MVVVKACYNIAIFINSLIRYSVAFHRFERIVFLSDRKILLEQWLLRQFSIAKIHLKDLTGDAGFRRYYRFSHNDVSYIAVDAPPTLSNNQGFCAVQQTLRNANIPAPEIFHSDLANGFFCLSDLGENEIFSLIGSDETQEYYTKAISYLPQVFQLDKFNDYQLPDYNGDFIRLELNIFTEWLVGKYLGLSLSRTEHALIQQAFDVLVTNMLVQPNGTMLRDYHSRNIMVTRNQELALIDFQDAVVGPISYDFVSLIKDCYVKWPAQWVNSQINQYHQTLLHLNLIGDTSLSNFTRWVDLTGAQRHLKCAGIFSRLKLRDGKSQFIGEIPRTLSYIVDLKGKYSELSEFCHFIENRIVPVVEAKQ